MKKFLFFLVASAGFSQQTMCGLYEVCQAVKKNDLTTIKNILEKDPSYAQQKDDSGWTLLHLAALRNNLEIATELITHKPLIDAKTKSGDTPLYWAVYMGYPEMTRFLLEKGASKFEENLFKETPYERAQFYAKKHPFDKNRLEVKQLFESSEHQ